MSVTEFNLPTRLIFGEGTFARLGDEAAKFGRRAMIVSGQKTMRRLGLLDKAADMLESAGLEVILFDKVEPNPRASTIDQGAAIARGEKIDVVIALGGGSAMDASKGVALASAGDKSIWHYITTRDNPPGKVPSLIMVPTVSASGSEVNSAAVITNWTTHQKSVVSRSSLLPKIAIVDPELTSSLPLAPTLAGGVDIFCHAVEPYITASHPEPLNDGWREAMLRTVVKYLPIVKADLRNREARRALAWASTMACSSFASLGGGDGSMTLHGIEHPLSGLYDIPHGEGLVALLPAWLADLSRERADRICLLGERVFGASDGQKAVEDWLKNIGMRLRLENLGVSKDRFSDLARLAKVSSPWIKNNPTPLEQEDIERIYRMAW
ncbi:iron-containing alcohol dehydrogenase [Dehalogenimonas etheniformans]|uniref:Alcohol dehydrogenase n=1 Tax=Dehalogenimonas etheniformans TaxID=1536648 RepID=A0A2P5P756_9CHLR|nr:iron-containing alcohol dehydrogenase [Dehalogenimonas etheniformans]PPD58132.1 alcohol dehydrogenase [Dehalogenimonas etheniformans]QNT75539.1 iron-containing alcohol dehydrogenase [Dehalogenimonas etheniformans]